MPEYLEKTNYRNPRNIADGPFQYGHDTKVPFWVYLGEKPDLLQCFNNFMGGYRQGKPSWVDPDFYPVADHLGRTFNDKPGAVLLVDVGGGKGHDLGELKAKHPNLPGRLVLQERQEVIDQIENLHSAIEATVHDFFTPQPIQGESSLPVRFSTTDILLSGAKAYYLHSVLHDWDDETCRKILASLTSAR